MLLCQMCCYYLLLSVFDMFFSLRAECKTTGNLIFLAKGNVLPIISSYKNELGKLLDILLILFKAQRLEIHRNSAEVSRQNSSNYEIQKNPAAQTVRLVNKACKSETKQQKISNLTNFSTILNTAKNKFNGLTIE